MFSLFNLIGAVVVLSFLVIIHEFGHYIAARKNGIKVEEFGIGFPPTLYKFKKWGTWFCINLIPFGGYVKLYGEDGIDPKMRKAKDSFVSKTPWQKLEVVLAGVFMNFMVFWILMSLAIGAGFAPLMLDKNDVINSIESGEFLVMPYITVENSTDSRIQSGDHVVKINNEPVQDIELIHSLYTNWNGIKNLEVLSNETGFTSTIMVDKPLENISLARLIDLPTLYITNIKEESVFFDVLEIGDEIVSINNQVFFDVAQFYEILDDPLLLDDNDYGLQIQLLRNGESLQVEKVLSPSRYIVADVNNNSPAEESGIAMNDVLIAINDQAITTQEDVASVLKGIESKDIVVTVERNNQLVDLDVHLNDDNMMGVFLAYYYTPSQIGIDFRLDSTFGSLMQNSDFSRSWYQVPFLALDTGYKLSKLTVNGFVGTIYNLVVSQNMPEDIGGPVQVAKLSYEFVGRGGVDLMSFVALISLSLAVINLLPIPALDGGRMIFILLEALRAKPINQKFEAFVHMIGFVLLMIFILIISFFDIIRL